MAPYGPFGKKKILTIPWQDIRPTIRWLRGDRRSDGYLPERVVFDHVLVFFVYGEGTYIIGNDEIQVQKHHLLLVPPFTRNAFSMRGRHLFTSVHFDWKHNFPPTPAAAVRQPYEVRFPLNVEIPRQQILAAGDPLILRLEQMRELWQEETSLARLQANALLFEVLTTLLKRAEAKKASMDENHAHTDQKRVELALALMEERLQDDLPLETMAQVAGLSIGHFSYIFRKWTGHSPLEHLIQLRVQKAKVLLENIHLKVKEVSNLCGFKDTSHFSKIFLRYNGISPSQYREMILLERGT